MSLRSARFAYDPVFVGVTKNDATLCKGSEGGTVQALQQALIDLGYSMPISTSTSDGVPDGIFGKETDAAVKTFQSEAGLGVDGIVGAQTIRALDELSAFEDLRPLRGAIDGVGAATDRIVRDPNARKVLGRDPIYTLWSDTTNMKASLLLYDPHSSLPPARLWLASTTRMDKMEMSGTMVGPNPIALMISVFLLALFAAMRPAGKKKWVSPRHPKSSASKHPLPIPPHAILIPVVRAWELLILAQKIQEIGATVAWQLVRNQVAKIRICQGHHPDRGLACAEAIKAFDKSQNKLLQQLNQLKGGKIATFPKLIDAANDELERYRKALEAVIKCLGCTGI